MRRQVYCPQPGEHVRTARIAESPDRATDASTIARACALRETSALVIGNGSACEGVSRAFVSAALVVVATNTMRWCRDDGAIPARLRQRATRFAYGRHMGTSSRCSGRRHLKTGPLSVYSRSDSWMRMAWHVPARPEQTRPVASASWSPQMVHRSRV
jgi:hypothetical protein